MKLTDEQKLIALMLAEIHNALKIKDGLDSAFIANAIGNDEEWAIEWKMPGLFHDGETPEYVRHVCDVLDMWEFLETGYSGLSAEDKARMETELAPLGTDVKWRGFDGNNEGEYMSAARMLIDEMDRFQHFKGRAGLNSHMQTEGSDKRMLAVFEHVRPQLGDRRITVDDLIEVLKARPYPDR